MKVLISIVVLAAVVAALYLLPSSVEEGPDPLIEVTESIEPSALELENIAPVFESGSQKRAVPEINELSEQERQQRIEATQAELASLMKRFDENLKNPQQRAQIKAQMDRLMKQYNELVLPVALRKVKAVDGVSN